MVHAAKQRMNVDPWSTRIWIRKIDANIYEVKYGGDFGDKEAPNPGCLGGSEARRNCENEKKNIESDAVGSLDGIPRSS